MVALRILEGMNTTPRPDSLLGRTFKNPLIGDEVTFVETAASTAGERTVLELRLAPGGGNPLHLHDTYDETFEVLEGTLHCDLDGETVRLEAGDSLTAPRGRPHRFYAGSEPARFRVTMRPAHAGFERGLAIACGLAVDGLVDEKGLPKGFARTAVLFTMGETQLPGWMGLVAPLLRWKASTKASRRLEREMVERYCGA